MRCRKYCQPCIVHDFATAVDLTFPDWDERMEVLRRCLEVVEKTFSPSALPSEVITAGYRVMNDFLARRKRGIPLAPQRKAANRAGLWLCENEISPALKRRRSWRDRIRFLLRWCVAGNAADFRSIAIAGSELAQAELERRFVERFRSAFEEGLSFDRTDDVLDALESAKSIAFVHDNCGEIAFDALLVRELRDMGKLVTSIVHGPISSDAALDDAEEVGLAEFSHRLLSTKRPTLGLILHALDEDDLDALRRADLVLIKGQANFYQFSEPNLPLRGARIVALLRTKCRYVFRRFGLVSNGNVIALLR